MVPVFEVGCSEAVFGCVTQSGADAARGLFCQKRLNQAPTREDLCTTRAGSLEVARGWRDLVCATKRAEMRQNKRVQRIARCGEKRKNDEPTGM